jgi:hypothetical protein
MKFFHFAIVLTIVSFSAPSLAADAPQRASDLKRESQSDEIKYAEGVKKMRQYLPQVLKEQKELYESDLFPLKTTGKKDAAAIMNTRFRYEGMKYSEATKKADPVLCNETHDEFSIPSDVFSLMREKKADGMVRLAEKLDFAKVNLGWMNDLLEYDFWSLPVSKVDCGLVPQMKIEAFAWAKLRLLKGIKDQDILMAVKEVRHFARLMMTWNDGLGQVYGSKLYGVEASFYEAIPKDKRPAGWKPVGKDISMKVRRFNRLYPQLLVYSESVPLDILDALYFNKYSSMGLCVAIAGAYRNMPTELDLSIELKKRLKKLEVFYQENCNSWPEFQKKTKIAAKEVLKERSRKITKAEKADRQGVWESLRAWTFSPLEMYDLPF